MRSALRLIVVLIGVAVAAVLAPIVASADGPDSWQAIAPPPGGSQLRLVTADPTNPNRLWAAGDYLYRSDDAGAAWTMLGSGLPSTCSGIFVADSANPSRLGTTCDGVWITGDGGLHWRAAGLTGMNVMALAFAPSDANVLYAIAIVGQSTPQLFRTGDGGATWSAKTPGLPSNRQFTPDDLIVQPTDANTVYLRYNNLIDVAVGGVLPPLLRSTDGGATFTALSISGLPIGQASNAGCVRDFAVQPAVQPILYTAIVPQPTITTTFYLCNGPADLYRSLDGGQSWESTPRLTKLFPGFAYDRAGLAFAPGQSSLMFVNGADGLYQSTDAGVTWQRQGPWPSMVQPVQASISAVVVDRAKPAVRYMHYQDTAGANGNFRSDDGGATWVQLNTNTRLFQPEFLGGLPNGGVYAAQTYLMTSPDGVTFARADRFVPGKQFGLSSWGVSQLAVNPKNPSELLLGSETALDGLVGVVWHSTDGGDTWDWFTGGISTTFAARVLSFAFDPVDPATKYVLIDSGGSLLYRSTNNGTWVLVSQGALASQFGLVTDASRLYRTGEGGIARSIDGGVTWITATTPISAPIGGRVEASALVFNGALYGVYSGFVGRDVLGSAVYKSTDAGATWTPIISPTQPPSPFALESGGPWLYVITTSSIQRTKDNGATWQTPAAQGCGSYVHFGPNGEVYTTWDQSALLRSDDFGASWQNAGAGIWGGGAFLFAGYGDSVYAGSGLGLVYHSTDGGKTWTPRVLPYAPCQFYNSINRIVVHPLNPDWVFVTPSSYNGLGGPGVLRSTDGGKTWTKVFQNTDSITAFVLDPNTGPVTAPAWLADLYTGVWRSLDGGSTWESLFSQPTYAFDVNPANDALMLNINALINVPCGQRSVDGGVTWAPITAQNFFCSSNGSDLAEAYTDRVIFNRFAPRTVYAGDTSSTDGGITWGPRNAPEALTFNPVDSAEVLGKVSGYVRSTDGGKTWSLQLPWPSLDGLAPMQSTQVTANGAVWGATPAVYVTFCGSAQDPRPCRAWRTTNLAAALPATAQNRISVPLAALRTP